MPGDRNMLDRRAMRRYHFEKKRDELLKKQTLQKASGQWITVKGRAAEKRREKRQERANKSRADRVEEARASSQSRSNNEDDYEEEVVEQGCVLDSGEIVRCFSNVSELDEEQRDILVREDKIMSGLLLIGGSFRGFYQEQPNRPFFVDIEGKKFFDDMGLRRALLLRRSQEVA